MGKWLGWVVPVGLDKPARLIIRLSFGFVSDSEKQILRRQCCLAQRSLRGHSEITQIRANSEKTTLAEAPTSLNDKRD